MPACSGCSSGSATASGTRRCCTRRSPTGPSATSIPPTPPQDNERLEFLGDAVLDFLVSDLLMERYPALPEGELSKLRASLVSEPGLAGLARELELGRLLRMGRGEARSGGREKNSILANALEALFAAIYLDSRETAGLHDVAAAIGALFAPRIGEADEARQHTDYKTELQELVQKRYKETVAYTITREVGPDHDKHFEAAVSFREREFGRGTGRSKKQAEQEAARNALEAFLHGSREIGP